MTCFSLFEREHLNTNDDENHHIFCTLLAVWDIIIIIIIIDLIAAPQQEFGNSPPLSLVFVFLLEDLREEAVGLIRLRSIIILICVQYARALLRTGLFSETRINCCNRVEYRHAFTVLLPVELRTVSRGQLGPKASRHVEIDVAADVEVQYVPETWVGHEHNGTAINLPVILHS